MKLTIETTLPAEHYVDITGNEICAMIDLTREMIRYNMGPEPAYRTTGPVYAADGTTIATWSIEL